MIKSIKPLFSHAAAVAFLPTAMALVFASGCTDDPTGPSVDGDAQTPPQGSEAAIEAWLAEANYKTGGWACEPAVHEARSPSPHGSNIICSNTKLQSTGATAMYPMGAASVKELYMDGAVIGHAIALKLADGASDGSKWYFYEKVGTKIFANGPGTKANVDGCSSCHAGAGSDAAHSGHDFVYTQVAQQ